VLGAARPRIGDPDQVEGEGDAREEAGQLAGRGLPPRRRVGQGRQEPRQGVNALAMGVALGGERDRPRRAVEVAGCNAVRAGTRPR
jgi:hypothetical protein